MASTVHTNGTFSAGDIRGWRFDYVEWVIYPVVILTTIISIGYLFELCGRKLSLNKPGTRVKTLSRSYQRRDSRHRKRAAAGPEYRYEVKDQVRYHYDQNDEFYHYNRIYLYLTFHVVALGMCLHLNHSLGMLWITWIHFFVFLVYIWFEVSLNLDFINLIVLGCQQHYCQVHRVNLHDTQYHSDVHGVLELLREVSEVGEG